MSDINKDLVGKTIEGYKINKPLGQGNFSTVYQAERKSDQKLVALKIIKIFEMDQKQREKCLQEVKLLQSVDHPNIVRYLDSFIFENELYIAIEWADKGDLKRFIRKCNQEGDKVDEFRIIEYTRQLACALNHMHEKRIIHRDLKPANILIFSDGIFKLGDLGLGRYMSDETFKAFSQVGTPLYMSPEVIRNEGYDFKSDVWSLGCVIYELITLKSPFRTDEKISIYDLFSKINKGDYPKINDDKYSDIVKDLVDKMLKVNPEERISLEEVIKLCEEILKQQEEKPRIDPFIVMEDIIEKLRLLNYEICFCQKYNKEIISKYFFACNLNLSSGLKNRILSPSAVRPGDTSEEALEAQKNTQNQFGLFYELSYWLINIIKQNISISSLDTVEIKLKKFDQKRQIEPQLHDLINDLKAIGIKIIENSKYQNGYGEGVCLVLTQLLDKYLINQNFIFKNPVLNYGEEEEGREINDFDEVITEDNNLNCINGNNKEHFANQIEKITNNNFYANGGSNSNANMKNRNISTAYSTSKRFHSGKSTTTQETSTKTASSTETEDFKFNPHNIILESNIDPKEWRREVDRVQKLLEIPEHPEFLITNSHYSDLSSANFNNIYQFLNNNNEDTNTKIGIFSAFLNKSTSNNQNFELLKSCSDHIEKELNSIRKFEKLISLKDNLKYKLKDANNVTSELNKKTQELNEIQDKITYMEALFEEIRDRIVSNNEREESLTNTDNSKRDNKIKDRIKELKEDIKRMNMEQSIFGSNLLDYKKQDAADKSGNDRNEFNKLFSLEDEFDEIL